MLSCTNKNRNSVKRMESIDRNQYSYLSKPKSSPYIYDTVINIFLKNATKYPDKEVFIQHDIDGSREAITYDELKKKSYQLARYLITKGIQKGDHVALFGPNSIEFVIAELGIIIAGGISVHLAVSTTDASDICKIFRETDCKSLLIDPGKKGEFVDSVVKLLGLFRESNFSTLHYRHNIVQDPFIVLLRKMNDIAGCPTLEIAMESNKLDVKFPEFHPEDIIVVFTTSGSTGRPKMVPHSHFCLINSSWPMDGDIPMGNPFYNDRPFVWIGGSPIFSIIECQPHVFTDASVAIAGNNTVKIWEIIKSENCTSAVLMPYFLCDLINKKCEYKDSFKLKQIFTGGQIIESYHAQVIGIYTEVVVMDYSSTEALFVAIDEPIKEGHCLETGRIGIISAGVEIKIVNIEGHVTPMGLSGEICVKSGIIFNGYYKNEEATKAAFLPGNWFRTGDIGFIRDDDSIIVEGRVKDVISRGTRKVMPHVIENIISQMEGILHVVAVAVPDKRLYEEVCACFVVKEGFTVSEKDVEQFCSKKMLKTATLDGLGDIPTYYLKFNNFPILATGKPNKSSLKIAAIEKLNLDQ